MLRKRNGSIVSRAISTYLDPGESKNHRHDPPPHTHFILYYIRNVIGIVAKLQNKSKNKLRMVDAEYILLVTGL